MHDILVPYTLTTAAIGAVAALFLVQLVIADIAGLRRRHPPGTPVTADPDDFLFRATRAHANTNESVAAFVLTCLFGVFSGAAPVLFGAFAWLYVAGRAGHMLCYYFDWRMPRSIMFGLALVALVVMLVLAIIA